MFTVNMDYGIIWNYDELWMVLEELWSLTFKGCLRLLWMPKEFQPSSTWQSNSFRHLRATQWSSLHPWWSKGDEQWSWWYLSDPQHLQAHRSLVGRTTWMHWEDFGTWDSKAIQIPRVAEQGMRDPEKNLAENRLLLTVNVIDRNYLSTCLQTSAYTSE